MKLNVYAVLDLKVGHYQTPFYQHTHGAALRMFADAASDQTTTIYRHPEDFTLFHLGEYDDDTGTFTNRTKPEALANGQEYRKPQPQLDITEAIERKKKGA